MADTRQLIGQYSFSIDIPIIECDLSLPEVLQRLEHPYSTISDEAIPHYDYAELDGASEYHVIWSILGRQLPIELRISMLSASADATTIAVELWRAEPDEASAPIPPHKHGLFAAIEPSRRIDARRCAQEVQLLLRWRWNLRRAHGRATTPAQPRRGRPPDEKYDAQWEQFLNGKSLDAIVSDLALKDDKFDSRLTRDNVRKAFARRKAKKGN